MCDIFFYFNGQRVLFSFGNVDRGGFRVWIALKTRQFLPVGRIVWDFENLDEVGLQIIYYGREYRNFTKLFRCILLRGENIFFYLLDLPMT